jgi:hypothetical protein
MYCLSPPHSQGTARSTHWGRGARWILVLACGLLLMLVSASTAAASPALATPASIDSLAPDGTTAADAISTFDAAQVLDTQPVRDSHSGEPTDSRDLIDEEDDRDDDDSEGDPRASHALPFSIEEILGQRSLSHVSELSLSPDESTLATPFLTDSVRRL